MTDTFRKLGQGQLATSAADIYAVPALTMAIVKRVKLVNTSGSPVTGIKLFDGGSVAANQITPTITLAANEAIDYDLDATLAASTSLKGVAGTATAVTYTVYGLEVS